MRSSASQSSGPRRATEAPSLESLTGYPGLFLWCLLSGILIPFPEDVPQVYAGMRVAEGSMSFGVVWPLAYVAVLLRDTLFFGLGRFLGDRAFANPWVNRLLGAERLERARTRVRERGPVAVLLARFSVGLRTGTFFVAGTMGVKARDFFVWDGLAMLVSVPLLTGLGYLFGEPVVGGILWIAARAKWAIPLAAALVLAGWLAWSRRQES